MRKSNTNLYANKKVYAQLQKFKLWLERLINYNKIYENFTFLFMTREVSSKEYTMHNHLLAVNEIVRKLYAHLESLMEIQPAFMRVHGQVVGFS